VSCFPLPGLGSADMLRANPPSRLPSRSVLQLDRRMKRQQYDGGACSKQSEYKYEKTTLCVIY